MVVTALRGALGFLTRLPVGHDDRAWEAFRTSPAAFPVTGYVVGALVALPFLTPLPDAVVTFAYIVSVYLVAGINHVDGVADLGDAAVVHGDPDRRREVMRDTVTGVGALLAVALTIAGLAAGAFALASTPPLVAVAVVVAAEVGAKLGMAAVACFGAPAHDGMGAALMEQTGSAAFVIPLGVAVPAAVLAYPSLAPAAALAGGVIVAAALLRWSRGHLGGASGDVFGAVNELGRVAGLHLGVVAWTLF